MEERLQDIDRRREKEVTSDKTTIRVESGVLSTSATKGDCHGIADRRKKKDEEEGVGGKTTAKDNSGVRYGEIRTK